MKSIDPTSSDSIDSIASADSLTWPKLDLSLFFTLDRAEKDRSPSQFVTGIVKKMCKAVYTFGKVDFSPSVCIAF